ncbi:MAG: PDZ domain-containing protein [Planctomycetes bacterium]|nr:PDZ domain-containing protein [Planctomycetota bacterium]
MRASIVLLSVALAALPAAADEPFLGVQMDSTYAGAGVRVEQVIEGSAAERAGFQAGDVLVEFDGRAIGNFEALREWIVGSPVGCAVVLGVERGGESELLVAVLGDRTRPGVAEAPVPDRLLAAFERLSWKARKAYQEPDAAAAARASEAAARVADSILPACAAALAPAERPGFEARASGHRATAAWHARMAASEVRAPFRHLDSTAPEQIRALLARLDDPDFAVREEASRRLLEVGPEATPILQEAELSGSPEVQLRARFILDRLSSAGEDLDRPVRESLPVEVEVVRFEGGRGVLEARFGGIQAGPSSFEAERVRDGRPAGRVRIELGAGGEADPGQVRTFSVAAGSASDLGAGERLVWIDMAGDPGQ